MYTSWNDYFMLTYIEILRHVGVVCIPTGTIVFVAEHVTDVIEQAATRETTMTQ